ncbi:MAG: hypothetical protein BroJett040_00480 [Oligoflexia bacterium]|nr:MAG: hypothetical protein BroJett040_00480 [Oligoflexia bacterium]
MGGESTSLKSIRENQKGVEALKNNNYSQAQEHFVHALKGSPFSSEVQLNLGLSYYGQGQMEKAESSYKSALEMAQNPQSQFASLFNLGEMAGKANKVDEALKYYQAALEVNPNSIEAKTNIELLILNQQQQKGQGQDQDQKDNQDSKDGKDSKDKKDQKQGDQDQDNQNQDKDKKEDQPKEYGKNKPQPKKFESQELTQSDVNKILSEIKQQEQRIRAEYNKKDIKEKPRDKDW